MSGKIMKCVY